MVVSFQDGLHNRGQERLLAASVLCVGAGGLGSPALLYLAAAGIGRLGVVDDDVVSLSNLQRQILFACANCGLAKVERARSSLQAGNPGIVVEALNQRLSSWSSIGRLQLACPLLAQWPA